jgi:hypothetical protein
MKENNVEAHATLYSRVLTATGSLTAVASTCYSMAASSLIAADQDLVSCCPERAMLENLFATTYPDSVFDLIPIQPNYA